MRQLSRVIQNPTLRGRTGAWNRESEGRIATQNQRASAICTSKAHARPELRYSRLGKRPAQGVTQREGYLLRAKVLERGRLHHLIDQGLARDALKHYQLSRRKLRARLRACPGARRCDEPLG